MDALDLQTICANHVEGAQRRWPETLSTCRECGQVWPCDASRLAIEILLNEAQMLVLPAGGSVMVRFNPDRKLGNELSARMAEWLRGKRPDINWMILQADEIVGIEPTEE